MLTTDQALDFSSLEADVHQAVSNNFVAVRKQHARSQRRMADLLDLSLSQYKKFENGTEIPRLHTTAKWSLLTGNNIYVLLLNTPYAKLVPNIDPVYALRPFAFVIGHLNPSMFTAWLNVIAASAELSCHYEEVPSYEVIDLAKVFDNFELKYYQNIAQNLRAFRAKHGFSQHYVAERMGMSAQAYAAYESIESPSRIPLTSALRFAATFNVNTASLSAGTFYGAYRARQDRRLAAVYDLVSQMPEGKRRSAEISAIMYSRWMQNDQTICLTRGGLLDHDEVVERRLKDIPR